jgi:putative hydrolase of the HAD superfamily
VVGDSLKNDIRPAHELGCTTIWLKGEGWNDDETAEGQADRVISDLAELLSCNISPK